MACTITGSVGQLRGEERIYFFGRHLHRHIDKIDFPAAQPFNMAFRQLLPVVHEDEEVAIERPGEFHADLDFFERELRYHGNPPWRLVYCLAGFPSPTFYIGIFFCGLYQYRLGLPFIPLNDTVLSFTTRRGIMNYTIYTRDCLPARQAMVTALSDMVRDTGYYAQLLDLTDDGTALAVNLPLSANLGTSSDCQLSCAICPRTGPGETPDVATLIGRMTALAAAGVRALALHHLGEPLLHPAFPELLAAAVAKFGVVTLATNGLAMDAARREHLLATPPHRVGLSLDAAHAAAGADSTRTLAALAALRRARDARGQTAPVLVVQSVIADEAAPDRAEVEKWLTVADAVEFRSFVPARGTPAAAAVRTQEQVCPLAFRHAVVRPDGQVQICCADFAGDMVIGNLDDAPLAEIWRGALAWRWRRRILTGDMPEVCRTCTILDDGHRARFMARARTIAGSFAVPGGTGTSAILASCPETETGAGGEL